MNLSLVLPMYNEEKNGNRVVEEFVAAFKTRNISYELIAVDNGSWDRTGGLIDSLAKKYPGKVKKVRVELNQGYGYGILQGLRTATGDHIGYTPGDGQVPAEDIIMVYEKGRELDLEFMQGKRIRKDSVMRRANTIVFNSLFHFFFRCDVYDIGSNPKIMKRKWYTRLNLISKDWFIDGEIALKTRYFKGKMKEFPVQFHKREEGKSKINLLSVLEMLKNILRWKLKALTGQIK